MAVKHVTLRAWSDNSDVAPVKINQGDILSRTIIFTLLDSGGVPIDLTLSSVRVHFNKPDGTVAYLTASIVNATAGIISVTLDSQCTAVPGTIKSIVQVTGPNGENTFINGPVFAVGAINIEGSIISANEFTALTDALKQVQGIANKVNLPSTMPTAPVIVKLLTDKSLVPALFDDFAPGIQTFKKDINSGGLTGRDYCIQLPDSNGILIYFGFVSGNTDTWSSLAGQLYYNVGGNINHYIPTEFPSMTYPYFVKAAANPEAGFLIACDERYVVAERRFSFNLTNPQAKTNMPYLYSYLAIGTYK